MSASGMRRHLGQGAHTDTNQPSQYTPTLTDYAELLVVSMGSQVPDDGIEAGKLYQLEGKKLHGANCTSIFVFEDSHAVFVDYNTGVHVTTDTAGRRTTAMLRPSR